MNEESVILMVEDEDSVLSVNRRILKRRGYRIKEASSAQEAYDYLKEHTPDLIILDIMLPDGNGFEICNFFRKRSQNPVLFLTGKDGVDDKIEGFSKGGDYYLTKPYNMDEMIAIIKRLLEREKHNLEFLQLNQVLIKGNLELDIINNTVKVAGEYIDLTSKEFKLLKYFLQNVDREISVEELYESVWHMSPESDVRTVRKHIMNLRSKIMIESSQDYDIYTSYGKGYVFR